MTAKTLYMVEHKTVWTGMKWYVYRGVFDTLPEAQEYARKKRDPEIFEIECREVCFKCKGTGETDGGGEYPSGETHLVKCDCQFEPAKQGEWQ